MLPNAFIWLMSPPRVTRRTRLWCPSVTTKSPSSTSSAYWTPLSTKKSVAGGWAIDHAPMSAIAVGVPSFPIR